MADPGGAGPCPGGQRRDQVGGALARAANTAPGRWPRLAVTAVFFINGLLFASWTAHIPHVKEFLRLDDGALGIALLGAPAGSVLAMLATARLLPRVGSRAMVLVTLIGYGATGPLVGLAGSATLLFGTLMGWGAFQGTLDVAMNTQAIAVERAVRQPLMPGFHASWSIGSLTGAAAGALGVAVGVSLAGQLLVLGVPCVLAGGWLALRMIPDPPATPHQADRASPADPDSPADPASPADPHSPADLTSPANLTSPADLTSPAEPADPADRADRAGPAHPAGPAGQAGPRRDGRQRLDPARPAARGRRLLGPAGGAIVVLGAIALADMLCEGAAADWAAVYLRTVLGAAPAVAALGYAAYSLGMVTVRLAGNRLFARFAVHRLLPALALLATAALAAGLAVTSVPVVLLGLAGLGAGLGTVIPAAFSAAGRLPGISPGTAVALVSACGWIGFVCGPVLIGQLASATSLRLALALLPALTALIAASTAASRALRPG